MANDDGTMTSAPAQLWLDRYRTGVAHGALGAFLLRQRWFTAAAEVVSLEAADAIPLRTDAGHTVVVLLVTATRRDGRVDEYCVPLTARPESIATVTEGSDPRLVEIATLEEGAAPVAVYDSLADGESVNVLWSLCRAGAAPRGITSALRFTDLGLAADDGEVDEPPQVRPLGREQSNSSVVRGDSELLKVIRRIVRGPNPELEMTDALAAVGFAGVAAPLASIEHRPDDGVVGLAGIVQPFLPNGAEGWALALTSLRVCYADAEADGDGGGEETGAAGGATFVPEAARIGDVVGAMHLALRDPELRPGMRGERAGAQHLAAWSDRMLMEVDRLVASSSDAAARLAPHRAALDRTFAGVRDLRDGGMAIRIHGDLHLGQLLRTDAGWTVVDFEGEPDLPVAERRRLSSALADVAGMQRSFDYAAAIALTERMQPSDPHWDAMLGHGESWSRAGRDAFWAAYTARVTGSGLLPSAPDDVTRLRRAFELRKAVYELGYELGHRPDWAAIPMRFIEENAI